MAGPQHHHHQKYKNLLIKCLKNSKTAIITGGTSGLGFSTAKKLLSLGYEISVFSSNEENR